MWESKQAFASEDVSKDFSSTFLAGATGCLLILCCWCCNASPVQDSRLSLSHLLSPYVWVVDKFLQQYSLLYYFYKQNKKFVILVTALLPCISSFTHTCTRSDLNPPLSVSDLTYLLPNQSFASGRDAGPLDKNLTLSRSIVDCIFSAQKVKLPL